MGTVVGRQENLAYNKGNMDFPPNYIPTIFNQVSPHLDSLFYLLNWFAVREL